MSHQLMIHCRLFKKHLKKNYMKTPRPIMSSNHWPQFGRKPVTHTHPAESESLCRKSGFCDLINVKAQQMYSFF